MDRKLINESIKRVNVGGKLLTNYLREIISFRYYNMMDETWLINQIKEDMCHLSMNFTKEINENHPLSYVLPDYTTRYRGTLKVINLFNNYKES
jgi:actin-related protein 6